MSMVLVYAVLTYLGAIGRWGIVSRADSVHDYMIPGLRFLMGLTDVSELRYNIGYALLSGGSAWITGQPELKIPVYLINVPGLIAICCFGFAYQRKLMNEYAAFFSLVFLLSSHALSVSITQPLSETVFLALFMASLWLTYACPKRPILIGFMLGMMFWVRYHTLLFCLFWPLLLETSINPKQFIKNGLLMLAGMLPWLIVFWFFVGGADLGGYKDFTPDALGGEATLTSYWKYFTVQITRLARVSYVQVLVFVVGSLSILDASVRSRCIRLWFFAYGSFVFQILMTVVMSTGDVSLSLRQSVYLCHYSIFAFLAAALLVSLWQQVVTFRSRLVPIFVSICVVVGCFAQSKGMHVFDLLKDPGLFDRKVNAFPLDHREMFSWLPLGAKVLAESEYSASWTAASKPDAQFHPMTSARRMKQHRVPFDETVTVVNEFGQRVSEYQALAVWRVRRIEFPKGFIDKNGNTFTRVGYASGPRGWMALYRIN